MLRTFQMPLVCCVLWRKMKNLVVKLAYSAPDRCSILHFAISRRLNIEITYIVQIKKTNKTYSFIFILCAILKHKTIQGEFITT